MLNEIKNGKYKKYTEQFTHIESYADESGPPIDSYRTPYSDLKVVKRSDESDDDYGSEGSRSPNFTS